jgi:serine/threonine protein kinase
MDLFIHYNFSIRYRYNAPEVLRDKDPVTNNPKNDIWSFGMIMYEVSD